MYWDKNHTANLGSVDISGANATTPYEAMGPIDIKAITGVVTVATTGATPSVITLAKRLANAGSSVNQISFTVPSGLAVNSVFRVLFERAPTAGVVASDGSTVYSSGDGVMELNPGEEFLLTSGGEGDAGTITFGMEFYPQGYAKRGNFTFTEIVATLL